ncbi:hypothetical protein [Desulfogranum marinum]|uniref:hypothetical protein n=1 Tax=Desulfogranum marinum TaxID=453220 RepID=UPI0029C78B0C|nr:hypothetical protein [Desulfogranum marinum]
MEVNKDRQSSTEENVPPSWGITIGGYCRHCQKDHRLEAGPARQACLDLMTNLRVHQRIDFQVPPHQSNPLCRTDYLFGEARGKMFGALVGRDELGREKIFYAFSGQYNGLWSVADWVEPVFDPAAFVNVTEDGEREVKRLTREIRRLSPQSDRRKELVQKRRRLSRQLMQQIHGLYRVTNFRGAGELLTDIFNGENGPPTGTGDCCAPKLLQHAALHKIVPVGLAEFYWGKENASRSRQHGFFYPSCATKCEPILGFFLCGLESDV